MIRLLYIADNLQTNSWLQVHQYYRKRCASFLKTNKSFKNNNLFTIKDSRLIAFRRV